MLIDQQNPNILPLVREVVECALDGRVVCFGVDDEEVFLGVWWVGYVLVCFVVRDALTKG